MSDKLTPRDHHILCAALVLLGMLGLWLSIPFSGWVLGVGLFCFLFG